MADRTRRSRIEYPEYVVEVKSKMAGRGQCRTRQMRRVGRKQDEEGR